MPNLVPNPGFEVNTTGWDTFGGTLTRDTGTFHAGVASGKTVAVANDQTRCLDVPVVVATYAFSCWVNGTAAMTLRIQLGSEAGYEEFVLTGSWQQLTRLIPSTAAGDYYIYFTAIDAGTYYLDEVTLTTGQILLPDADIATTGWATAPLFSKVNDSSDATVITATAC